MLVAGGDFELIDILLKAGADVNAESKYGGTPLIGATMCPRAVNKFLDAGADVNRQNINKESALSHAAKSGNLSSAKLLLEAGADISVKDVNEMTPLLHAIQSGQMDVVDLIYRNGGKKDLSNERSAATALSIAAGNPKPEMIRFLLETARVDPNSRAKYGTTALTTAAMRGNLEIVRHLLGAGADPNIRGAQTAAPLTWAADYGHTEVVKVLLEAKADINVQESWSPLITAARKGHPETLRVLIKAGGNINQQAYDGKTGLMDAATGGHVEVVRLLIDAGADVNIRDEDDNVTALSLALKMTESGQTNPKYFEIIKLLRQAGGVE